MVFNLNDIVKVKLNDRGLDIYLHRYDELLLKYDWLPPVRVEMDKDGYVEFQLWDFMNLFGKYMYLTAPPVLESLDIIIPDRSELVIKGEKYE